MVNTDYAWFLLFCIVIASMRTYRAHVRAALYACIICMRTIIMYANINNVRVCAVNICKWAIYAYCVIRMRNMYVHNNYVRVQQLRRRTTIMYTYNNHVRVQP